MRGIVDHEELAALCGGDTLCLWAAQGLDGRSRAWRSEDGRAVAVAGPGLAQRDRLAVHGPADAVVPLTREVLAEVGPNYRPLGDRKLIEALAAAAPRPAAMGAFGWMDCRRPTLPLVTGKALWLADAALPEIAAFVEDSFPDSYAKPGAHGVERWAGVRDDRGRLAAVAAFAWSAPTIGLLAGVTVHPGARRRGLGRDICSFLLAEALAHHGTAALMVDDRNHAALRLYQDLGFLYRAVGAVAVSDE